MPTFLQDAGKNDKKSTGNSAKNFFVIFTGTGYR
jgi:hypothetical protein